MPRNGSGTFTRNNGTNSGATTWNLDRLAAIAITSSNHDIHDQDIADAITASIAKDGQTTPTANLPMGGYKHTGVGDAAATNQYCTIQQHIKQAGIYATLTSGSSNAFAVSTGFSLASLVAGMRFSFYSNHTITGAATLNVDGLGAVTIRNCFGGLLSANDIMSTELIELVYTGTVFRLLDKRVVGTSNEVEVSGASGYYTVGLPSDVTIATSLTVPTVDATSSISADTISEHTATAGVTIDSVLLKDNNITCSVVTTTTKVATNTIDERTAGSGVTIDSVLLKDDSVSVDAVYNHGTHLSIGTTGSYDVYFKINSVDQLVLVDGALVPNVNNDLALGSSSKAFSTIYSFGIQSIGTTNFTALAPSGKDVILQSNGTSSPSTLTFGWSGRLNFAPTSAYGTSSKTVGTDAPADWLEIQINGTTLYLPCYGA